MAPSDFSCHPPARRLLPHGAADELAGVGCVGLATFSLGFVEACLHVERRPIPLRFALKFAAVNVIPSAVWSTVSARHVALASNVPESALVLSSGWSSSFPAAAAGRRVMALQSVRAIRCVAGSYGLALALWRLYGASDATHDDPRRIPLSNSEERVLRVAPVSSALSRASKAKHGDHIAVLSTPRNQWQQGRVDVKWSEFGLFRNVDVGTATSVVEMAPGDRLSLVEFELGDASAVNHAKHVLKRAKYEGDIVTVGVLGASTALPALQKGTMDMWFNPLSTAIDFVTELFDEVDAEHVLIVVVDGDKSPRPRGVDVSAEDLARGLVFRGGVASTILRQHEAKLGVTKQKDPAVVFVADSATSARLAASELNGLIAPEKMFFVVTESLSGTNLSQSHSSILLADVKDSDTTAKSAPRWLSVADTCDATLQDIREMLRRGMSTTSIQAALYRAHGPQWRSSARPDQFSDIGRYI